MEYKIPAPVVDIIELINSKNKECFLIGGAPRDYLLGKEPRDYDLCTNLPLEEVSNLIPGFHLMKQNERRNTGIIRINDTIIEISEYKAPTLEEDIQKRDFTINGIAMDKTGKIIDDNNYQQDIKNRTIALIDPTGNSIIENPMLILRAIRLACQLDFQIESNTSEKIKQNGVNLSKVIGQRANVEFSKILPTEKFPDYLKEYFKVFVMIMPELINMDMDKTYKLLKLTPSNNILKLAALFTYSLNCQKDFTQFANRMCMDKKTIRLVNLLLSYKNKNIDISREGINRTIFDFNIQYVDLLLAYKKILLSIEGKDVKSIDIAAHHYQKAIDEIIATRISGLKINEDRIKELGYSKDEARIILEDVKGKIIANTLQNNSYSIEAYILNKHKKS